MVLSLLDINTPRTQPRQPMSPSLLFPLQFLSLPIPTRLAVPLQNRVLPSKGVRAWVPLLDSRPTAHQYLLAEPESSSQRSSRYLELEAGQTSRVGSNARLHRLLLEERVGSFDVPRCQEEEEEEVTVVVHLLVHPSSDPVHTSRVRQQVEESQEEDLSQDHPRLLSVHLLLDNNRTISNNLRTRLLN